MNVFEDVNENDSKNIAHGQRWLAVFIPAIIVLILASLLAWWSSSDARAPLAFSYVNEQGKSIWIKANQLPEDISLEEYGITIDSAGLVSIENVRKFVANDENELDRKQLVEAFKKSFELPSKSQKNFQAYDYKVTAQLPDKLPAKGIDINSEVDVEENTGPSSKTTNETADTNGLGHVTIKITRVMRQQDPAVDENWNDYVDTFRKEISPKIVKELVSINPYWEDAKWKYKSLGEIALVELLRAEAEYLAIETQFERQDWSESVFDTGTEDLDARFKKLDNYRKSYVAWLRVLIDNRKERIQTSRIDQLRALSRQYLDALKAGENGSPYVKQAGPHKGYRVDGSVITLAVYCMTTLYLEQDRHANFRYFTRPSEGKSAFQYISQNLVECIEIMEGTYQELEYQTIPTDVHSLKYFRGSKRRKSLVGGRFLYYTLKAIMEYDELNQLSSKTGKEEAQKAVIYWLRRAGELRDDYRESQTLDGTLDSYTTCYLKRSASANARVCAFVKAHNWAKQWRKFGDNLQPREVSQWSVFYKKLGTVGSLASDFAFVAKESESKEVKSE